MNPMCAWSARSPQRPCRAASPPTCRGGPLTKIKAIRKLRIENQFRMAPAGPGFRPFSPRPGCTRRRKWPAASGSLTPPSSRRSSGWAAWLWPGAALLRIVTRAPFGLGLQEHPQPLGGIPALGTGGDGDLAAAPWECTSTVSSAFHPCALSLVRSFPETAIPPKKLPT